MNESKDMIDTRTDDMLLERMYELLNQNKLMQANLPHSTTYYVREALHARTGKRYTFKQINMAINLFEKRQKEKL
tara:strand:+ start:49 stop:273 length:225 start_codon:yes stop_codon:yes gene_type:complete